MPLDFRITLLPVLAGYCGPRMGVYGWQNLLLSPSEASEAF